MRRALAWLLFLAGDAVAKVMRLHDLLGYLYPVYSKLMSLSSDIQGPSGKGPWSAIAIEARSGETACGLDP